MRYTKPLTTWMIRLLTTTLAVAGFAGAGCGLQDAETETVEESRQALVSEQDLEMKMDDGSTNTTSQALGDKDHTGKRSKMGLLTAGVVVGTSRVLLHHAGLMQAIVALPPTRTSNDRAVWEDTDDGFLWRVTVERKDVPKGKRFRYRLKARPADDPSADFQTIFGGWVVRTDLRAGHNPGFGVVRYHFDNYGELTDSDEHQGKVRVAFRRAGGVHQIKVRAIGVETPEDPDFPPLASYRYTLLPNHAGSLKWFSKDDFNKDGEKPLENIAMHSKWRDDKSGISVGVAMDGTMDHDHVSVAECWDSKLMKTYGRLGWSDGNAEEGKRSRCVRNPDKVDHPAFQSNLPDEDPDVPSEHPKESS